MNMLCLYVFLCVLVFVCVCVCVCFLCVFCVSVPVAFVGEVVYNGRADAGHAPLAVVPSSCDDRELRSTQTLLTVYSERGSKKNKPTHTIQLRGEARTNFDKATGTQTSASVLDKIF